MTWDEYLYKLEVSLAQHTTAKSCLLIKLQSHMDEVDWNVFQGLLQSEKDKRLNMEQLYVLVYALFNAISALPLFPRFKAFTGWHNTDTQWWDSLIRHAMYDDNLWELVCRRVDLLPRHTLTATVRRPDGSVEHREVSAVHPCKNMFFPQFPLRMSGMPLSISAAAAKAAAASAKKAIGSSNCTSIKNTSMQRVVKLKLAKEHMQSNPTITLSGRHPTRIVKLKTGKPATKPQLKKRSKQTSLSIAIPSLPSLPTIRQHSDNSPTISVTAAQTQDATVTITAAFPCLSATIRSFRKRPAPLKITQPPPSEGPPFSPLTPLSPSRPPISPLTPPPNAAAAATTAAAACDVCLSPVHKAVSSPVPAVRSYVVDARARARTQ